MIDFKNASFVKLRPVNDNAFEKMVAPILVDGEELIGSYQSIRDGVVFTDKRIIAINVQGITGKKKDFTSSNARTEFFMLVININNMWTTSQKMVTTIA